MNKPTYVSPIPITDEPGVKGVVRVSQFGQNGAPGAARRLSHVSTYVNGLHYNGMEDNDLRGFLDGRFTWGWNQPGQMHVRVGRAPWGGRSPKYGEHELVRVIQRWDDIRLPGGAKVKDCELRMTVEASADGPLRLMLYSVRKEWNPGSGGVDGDSSSAPKQGEVWWNDVAYGQTPWGLPGAGFASADHPEADTDLSPLADALYEPGDSGVVFSSARLSNYAEARIAAAKPLLFLIKLSDYQEDIPGALITLYSGNYGDSRNVARRPRLVIEWMAAAERRSFQEEVALEYGRSQMLGRFSVENGGTFAVTFKAEAGYADPAINVREGSGERVTSWSEMASPFHARGEWIEVRVLAASTPVPLGGEFTAELKDTWVMTKRPEDQVVRWTFISPTGRRHEVAAAYQGEFAWRVQFAPDEIGPWRYRWTHTFTTQPNASSEGRFDVLGVDAEKVRLQLEMLAREFEALRPSADIDAVTRLQVQFYRLQRAAMLLETPESFQAASGIELRELLNRVRSLLWGKPMPDQIPMVAHRRPGDAGAPKRRLHPLLRRGLRKSKAMSLRVLSLVNR